MRGVNRLKRIYRLWIYVSVCMKKYQQQPNRTKKKSLQTLIKYKRFVLSFPLRQLRPFLIRVFTLDVGYWSCSVFSLEMVRYLMFVWSRAHIKHWRLFHTICVHANISIYIYEMNMFFVICSCVCECVVCMHRGERDDIAYGCCPLRGMQNIIGLMCMNMKCGIYECIAYPILHTHHVNLMQSSLFRLAAVALASSLSALLPAPRSLCVLF